MSNTIRVSDVLTQHIQSWNDSDLIAVTSGTGSGKSYFIKNLLYAHAKKENRKILYLVNRKKMYDQFKAEIDQDGKTDLIDLYTYQKLEKHGLYKQLKELKKYKYVICDEFHYFITDAAFNHTTDISLDIILRNSTDKVNIFMSATSGFMLNYLEEHLKLNVKKYDIESDYNHIDKLYFYQDDKTVKKYLFDLPADEKAIYFCHSAKTAYDTSKEFKNSLFLCSEGNEQYKKYMKNEKIQQMLVNERFDEQILFATNALDNGVNIIDPSVKHIIIDIEDFDVLIQCLGRKRCKPNEKITLIVKTMTNNQIGGRMSQLKKKIEMAEFLLNGDYNLRDFLKKYPRKNHGTMIYDVSDEQNENVSFKKVNEIMYKKAKYDIELFENMISVENGYIEHALKILKRETYENMEQHYNALSIEDYLNQWVGKKMFKDEQKQFKEYVNSHALTPIKGSHGSIGHHTINGYFKDNDMHYVIEKERETKGSYKGKWYWLLGKITF